MKDQTKSIAIVTPSLGQGGMERVISEIANFAVHQNYKTYIICLVTKQNQAYPIDKRVIILAPTFSYTKNVTFKLKAITFLTKTLRALKVDTVLSFSEVFNPLAIIAGKLTKTPVYISDRSSPTRRHGKYKFLIRKLTYPYASGMIAQTESARLCAIQNKFNTNICVIPNPLKEFKNYLDEPSKQVVISVGRLIRSKNFEALIDIFSKVGKPDWELWIVGEGPHRASLEEYVGQSPLNENIYLIGAVSDIDRLLAQCSIFAFTSISEGFPNALSEAMAFPLASIAYDCPAGPADLIQDGVNGFLIPMDDEELFKEKLVQLMEDKKLRERLVSESIKNRLRFSRGYIINKYLRFVLP